MSRRKQYSAWSKHTTPTCAAVVDPAEVAPATPSISPSLQQPELQEPSFSPTLQQIQDALPSSPALQPQQTTSVTSHQHPPVHLIIAPSLGEDAQELSPALPAAPPPSPRPNSPSPHTDSPSPCADSPGPETSNPTLCAVLTSVDSNQLKCVPPPAEAFTFSNISPFITPATIQYLQTVSAGQRWVEIIISYLRFEELPVAKGVRISCASDLFIFFTNNTISPSVAFPLGLGQARYPHG